MVRVISLSRARSPGWAGLLRVAAGHPGCVRAGWGISR